MLTVDATTRRTPPALFFVLAMAFAVCLWGLHYKLSLYHFGAAKAAGPAAKLLSPKERPLSSGRVDSAQPTSLQPQSWTIFPVFLIAAIILGSHLVPSYWIWTETTVEGRQQSHGSSLCFLPRPPPVSLLPN